MSLMTFFFFMFDAARESPSFLFSSYSSALSSPPPPSFRSDFSSNPPASPPPLPSGLNVTLPAGDDSLGCYVEKEKEEEQERWRRCGDREPFLFSLTLVIFPLDSRKKWCFIFTIQESNSLCNWLHKREHINPIHSSFPVSFRGHRV